MEENPKFFSDNITPFFGNGAAWRKESNDKGIYLFIFTTVE